MPRQYVASFSRRGRFLDDGIYLARHCLQLIVLRRERALTDLFSIHLAQNTASQCAGGPKRKGGEGGGGRTPQERGTARENIIPVP